MQERLEKLNKADAALIIIDMQDDFVAAGAPLECGEPGRATIPIIWKMKAWAKENGIPVIYTQERHRPDLSDFGLEAEHEPPHCLLGTSGHNIIRELAPEEGDYVVDKTRYSGWFYTDLPLLLNGLKKNTLIFTGVCTDVCVYSTAKDASQAGKHVIIVSDACAATLPKYHEIFLEHLDFMYGDVADSDTVINTLNDNGGRFCI